MINPLLTAHRLAKLEYQNIALGAKVGAASEMAADALLVGKDAKRDSASGIRQTCKVVQITTLIA